MTTVQKEHLISIGTSRECRGPKCGISHTSAHIEDVDSDGDLDLVLHFPTQETGIVCGDTEAFLSGKTFDGTPIGGASDTIATVGCN